MSTLSELKKKLYIEKRKPKNTRNNASIEDIQDQIKFEKEMLHSEFYNRREEKRITEVNLNLSLWKKKNDRYGKIREANKKERLAAEKKKMDKLHHKKKAN